jgi:hypothetical protein
MKFFQTCLDQNESARPKDTTLYVYNMSLFLVDCLINWDDKEQQRASSTRCLQKKDRVLTTPRSSKSPFPDSIGLIDDDIEVYHWQIPTLSHHSYKPLCTGWSEVIIIFTETRRVTLVVPVYLDSWCVCDQTNTPCLRVLSCLDLLQHFRLLSSILNRSSVSIKPSVTPDILRCSSEEDTPMSSGNWITSDFLLFFITDKTRPSRRGA